MYNIEVMIRELFELYRPCVSILLRAAIGGSGEGRRRHVPPPTGSISFIFAHVFAEKCTRQRLAPPQQVSAPPTANPGSATGCILICV